MSKKIKTTGNKKSILLKIAIGLVIFAIAMIIVSFTTRPDETDSIMTFASSEFKDIDETVNEEEEIVTEEIEANPIEIAENETEEESTPIINEYTIYCVVAGDSYSKICKDFYGDENLCWALMEYNGANGDSRLSVLQEIKVPNIDNEEFKAAQEKAKPVVTTNTTTTKNTTTNTTQQQTQKKSTNSNYSAPTSSGSVRNNTGSVDTSGFTYLGSYKITGYTPGCAHCCGSTAGITASGVPAKVGRTIAAKGFSFGTTLYIKGYGFYVVEDTGGFGSGTIDMAAGSHEECYSITNSGVDVYLVSNN